MTTDDRLPPNAAELLRANLDACLADIAGAAQLAGRQASDVRLLPVTKYAPPEVLRLLHGLGQRAFGESRVQRVLSLRQELADLPGVEWHLIGHLQRNKVARALETCAAIHSVDSFRIAQELVARAAPQASLPDLYVEVNVAREDTKTGLREVEVEPVLEFLRTHPRARDHTGTSRVKGLMTMAPYAADPQAARPYFRRLRELRDTYVRRDLLPAGAGLSMGMSSDFAVAVEEGATTVRVGTRLYSGLLPGD